MGFQTVCTKNNNVICIPLGQMDFNKEKKILLCNLNYSPYCGMYPDIILVTSHHTGETVKFVQDREAAYENEFWDGEMMEYIPHGIDLPNVKKLVVWFEN